ncbi:hypothetical protein F5890DRAFT_139794 [Lentinula detonsa]|uniref:Uncharacterized protein n=1 Tax=Lentinula detonsa TaxID=2804962 RepID=A0AA38PZ25_9AGAR|nr:hypothetical protein F5890DRAFT_139794 [Lentinula detonsa]
MTDYGGRPEFDLCDSASATSSTLVITPSSGRDILKRHTQSGSIVHRIQEFNDVNFLNSPQPLRLHQLPPYFQSTMFQSQSTGKGPIQPHVSNLPRRKPKQSSAGALPREPPTLVKPDAVKSLSSTSIRTNAAKSPSPPRSSPSPSPSSSKSRGLKAYLVDDEPSRSIAGVYVKPITPIAPVLEVGNALNPSKGHIQPHITNVPRRRARRPHLPLRAQTPVEQRRLREKEAWKKARCLQEVIKGSGVWVAFWDWERAFEDSDDEDQSNVSFVDELLHAERIIQVITREQRDLDLVASTDGIEDAPKNVLKLFLPLEIVRVRDDGVSHLSIKQISLARRFLLNMISPLTTGGRDSASETVALTSVPTTPTTSSTPSISCCSSSLTSPFASPTSSPYSLPPSSTSSERKRLIITVPKGECAVDALALVVVAFSVLGDIPEASTPFILEFLIRLYDLEGLDHHWQGALSCDGVEWLEGVLQVQ